MRKDELVEENRDLLRQLELLNSCLDILFDGVTILDTDRKVIYVNKIKAERIGYTKEELIGIDPIAFVADKDLQRYREEFYQILYKEEVPKYTEYNIKHKDGREIPMEISFTVLKDPEGKLIGGVGASRDISQQRNLMRKLVDSEEKYRLIFESSGTAMLTTSDDGTILMPNQNFERLSGYARDELIGKKKISDFFRKGLSNSNRLAQTYPMRYERVFINRFEKKKNVIVIENILTSDPIAAEKEKVIALIDITESKRVMREMKNYQRQLKNLSTHLQNVLEEERTRLAYEIHDSLGQELTAIRMQLNLLVEKWPPSQQIFQSKIDSMVQCVDNIMKKTRDISLFLRPVVLDHFGFESAILWLIEDFEKNTKIHCNLIYDDNCSLSSNQFSLMLFRIVQELLTNTARHSEATQVNIEFKRVGNTLHLEFCDNGKGIPQNRVFGMNSFGLLGIRERVLSQGGAIKIRGKRNTETKVIIQMPLPVEFQID